MTSLISKKKEVEVEVESNLMDRLDIVAKNRPVLRDITNVTTDTTQTCKAIDEETDIAFDTRTSKRNRKSPVRLSTEQYHAEMKKTSESKRKRVRQQVVSIAQEAKTGERKRTKISKKTVKRNDGEEEEEKREERFEVLLKEVKHLTNGEPVIKDKETEGVDLQRVVLLKSMKIVAGSSALATPERTMKNRPASIEGQTYAKTSIPDIPVIEVGTSYQNLMSKRYTIQQLRDFCQLNMLRPTGQTKPELARSILRYMNTYRKENVLLISPTVRMMRKRRIVMPATPIPSSSHPAQSFMSPIPRSLFYGDDSRPLDADFEDLRWNQDMGHTDEGNKLSDFAMHDSAPEKDAKRTTKKVRDNDKSNYDRIPKFSSEHIAYRALGILTLQDMKQFCRNNGITTYANRIVLKKRILSYLRRQL